MSLADKEFVAWGGRFTRREFFGTPAELVFGLIVVFGPPLFMQYAMKTYPLLDGNAPLYWIVALPALAISWPLCILFRNKLFPWGHKAPVLMWGCTLAVAMVSTMFALGATIFANGAFDSSVAVEHRAEVTKREGKDHSVAVAGASLPKVSISVDLTRYEYYDIQKGDSLSLFVHSGALGAPWIGRYSLR